MPKIFFDADILFTLDYSDNPKSGARRVLLQGYLDKYSFITSTEAIQETRRNLPTYNSISNFKKLAQLLEDFNFKIIEVLDERLINMHKSTVHKKDVHIFVAALQSKSDYLLTFNLKHFLTTEFKRLNLKLQILNPKEFIHKVILP